MSGILEGVKRAANRRGISDRVDGLERAVDAAEGRLPDDIVADARVVLDRAGQRLRLSPDHTVVGLAGATGSGKSSLFNAICGLDLAGVGIKRPTTSWALACAWGSDGAPELLTWLGIPSRHQVSRGSMLSDEPADRELAGLVLLDLPDHDSTEVSHHLEVDRLVDMADLLVWILDPQKYADAAIHDRYLRPLAAHADVMLVVLNHIDELPPDQVAPCLADVRRVLAADGLASVPVLGTSAVRGDGLDLLRDLLIERVSAKESSRTRMLSSVTTAAEALSAVTGNAHPEGITSAGRAELLDAFADAAGVPVVVQAVESSTRTRARQATGWPLTKWLSKLRPDPLKRLHLGSAGSAARGRTSIPAASPVQRARVDVTVREVVDEATRGLPAPWVDSTRRASVARLDDLGDALDRAVMTTELGGSRTPLWWKGTRALQWLLFLAAVTGAVWLGALAAMSFLQFSDPSSPDWHGVALPTVLLIGGVVLGVVVAMASRAGADVSARRKAAAVDRRLRDAIGSVGDEMVIGPIAAEIDAYCRCRDGVAAALKK